MPFGIAGQYEIAINIDGRDDAVREQDFDFFTIIEQLGGSLPTFELQFRARDPSLASRFNEGCQLSVRYSDGADRGTLAELFIVKPMMKRVGEGEYIHRLVGTTNQPGYNTNQRVSISNRVTSLEAITQAASPYFEVESNVRVQDEMHWIQHNISDRRFIFDTLMHMDIPDSFPLLAVTVDNRLRVLDARRVAAGEPVASFGYDGSGYLVDVDFEVRAGGTLLNEQAAYGIEQVEQEAGSHRTFSDLRITQPVKNLLSNASGFNRAEDSPSRRWPPVSRTSDMHPNFWEAHRRNMASSLAYSGCILEFGVRNRLVRAHAGDLAMFRDDERGGAAIESYSGLYYISKVSTKIEARGMISGVALCRENINRPQGLLR